MTLHDLLHFDQALLSLLTYFGAWFYLFIFLVIFCETGLIIFPFLPGDSLLFALGALAALPGSELSLLGVIVVCLLGAVTGDSVNYIFGIRLKWIFQDTFLAKFVNAAHLAKAKSYYEKHGAKTIVLARFLPIIRTFTPFVAGLSEMRYSLFTFYNVLGAVCWVCILVPLGYAFGNIW
jgi:membrane-associated protein